VDRGCHVVRVADPYGRILGFLDSTIIIIIIIIITIIIIIINRTYSTYICPKKSTFFFKTE
jgi:hypothetical protein